MLRSLGPSLSHSRLVHCCTPCGSTCFFSQRHCCRPVPAAQFTWRATRCVGYRRCEQPNACCCKRCRPARPVVTRCLMAHRNRVGTLHVQQLRFPRPRSSTRGRRQRVHSNTATAWSERRVKPSTSWLRQSHSVNDRSSVRLVGGVLVRALIRPLERYRPP
jgi:hypothetical protein